MLVERAFVIDYRLPQELRDTAHVLSSELAWATPDALRVVDWLRTQGSAVVGVELWWDKDGAASWQATSNYSPHPGDETTPVEVARCAEEAARFIRDFEGFSNTENLFNLTWLPPVPDETPATLAT